MKCCFMQHFVWVFTVISFTKVHVNLYPERKGKKTLVEKMYNKKGYHKGIIHRIKSTSHLRYVYSVGLMLESILSISKQYAQLN